MSEHTDRHWFQKFRSEYMSLCDEPRSGRQLFLDYEALKTDVEEGNSQICGELAERFLVSDETVRLQLHRTGKAYKLSK